MSQPVVFSIPAPDYNGIAATQNITTSTGGYVVINGDLSNALSEMNSAGGFRATLPGIQRSIGIFSTGDISAVVFYASGVDTNGRVVTASFAGASGGSSAASDSFATFTAEFHIINTLFSTAAATSMFTVGTGATGATRFWTADTFANPFNVTVGVLTATICSITVQDTPQNPNTSTAPTTFSHATLQSVVANQQSNYAYPVRFVRAIWTTNTASGVTSTVTIQQAG